MPKAVMTMEAVPALTPNCAPSSGSKGSAARTLAALARAATDSSSTARLDISVAPMRGAGGGAGFGDASCSRPLFETVEGGQGVCAAGCGRRHCLDAGRRRAALRPGEQCIDRLRFPGDHRLDAAVMTVAHPTAEPEAQRFLAQAVAVTHALYFSGDD